LSTMPQLVADLQAAARTGASSVTRYGRGPQLEALIEIVEPRISLVIVGAGADALPLVSVAQALGWHITVVDTHARALTVERFSQADTVLLCRPEEVSSGIVIRDGAAVVLMTHNYAHDRELLPWVLRSGARYVGVLGSRQRAARLLSELAQADEPHTSVAKLHAPIGLDLGAETPSEIALAVAAEILASLKARAGGHLRDRPGSIHGADRHRVDMHTAEADETLSTATFSCGLAATA
jgi:xanthine dehydrogenase accessory factor